LGERKRDDMPGVEGFLLPRAEARLAHEIERVRHQVKESQGQAKEISETRRSSHAHVAYGGDTATLLYGGHRRRKLHPVAWQHL